MFRQLVDDFKNATTLEQFNSVASLGTISGISILTIFNSIGGINFMQMSISFLVLAIIFFVCGSQIFLYLAAIKFCRKYVHSAVLTLMVMTMIALFLFILLFMIVHGIELIRGFEDY